MPVSAAAAASFSISNPGTQVAGDGFSLSITGAQDAYGNAVSGTATVAFSDAGAHNSPNSTAPTLTNVTVTNGSGSATQVLVNAESGVQLQATLGGVNQTTSAFTVNATSLASYTLSDPGNQTAGSGFNLSISAAVDTYGNGVNGTATVGFVGVGSHDSPDGFSPALQNIAVAAAGPGTGSATQVLYNEETGVQLYTSMGGINDTTVAVAAQTVGAGTNITVHAGGFDSYGNYRNDESVNWSVSGGIGSLSTGTGTATTLTASTAGSGAITADHATVTDGVSGTITATGLHWGRGR